MEIVNKKKAAALANLPEWIYTTPENHSYQLIMFESSSSEVQSVGMTRREYVALKKHLARMRGLTLPTGAQAEILRERDKEELRASYLASVGAAA